MSASQGTEYSELDPTTAYIIIKILSEIYVDVCIEEITLLWRYSTNIGWLAVGTKSDGGCYCQGWLLHEGLGIDSWSGANKREYGNTDIKSARIISMFGKYVEKEDYIVEENYVWVKEPAA